MRLLGVDFGFRRIGLAVMETEFGVTTPRPALAASGTLAKDATEIDRIAKQEKVDEIILGFPIEEDGNVGKMARVCQSVAEKLNALGNKVELVDERLSSVEAEKELRQSDLKASERRKLRDGEAARILLERYMEQREKS